jgi:hypothetical protein
VDPSDLLVPNQLKEFSKVGAGHDVEPILEDLADSQSLKSKFSHCLRELALPRENFEEGVDPQG